MGCARKNVDRCLLERAATWPAILLVRRAPRQYAVYLRSGGGRKELVLLVHHAPLWEPINYC